MELLVKVMLNDSEIAELDKQDPKTASAGGFQGLLVKLQKRVDRTTRELDLTKDDLRRISLYAFDYRNGGWEDRLKGAFGRTLGATLGR